MSALPIQPPVRPMLARLVRELPIGDYIYEPKWDGFRCVVFRDGDDVDIRSRNDKPLARYFPELVSAVREVAEQRLVLDGEILVTVDGAASFTALMARLHPAASRSALLAQETPACLVAFDVLAVGARDLTGLPFEERRAVLESLLPSAGQVSRTSATSDAAVAGEWLDAAAETRSGIDGVVAKPRDLRYEQNKRTMIKVKHERTADCVVVGARLFADPVGVASLLLGLYDEAGVLQHVGVASSFGRAQREALLAEIAPLVVALDEHPWRNGFGLGVGRAAKLPGAVTRWTPEMSLDWVPLRPTRVCEVAYDRVDTGYFRHPARFRHWRPDREPESCGLSQLDPALAAAAEVPPP